MQITVYDATLGKPVTRDATPAEIAQADADARVCAATTAALDTLVKQRTADLAAVRAKAATDPAFAALARILGA